MFRICTIASLIVAISAISTAQAGTSQSLADRIHDAAVTACAPESAPGMSPRAHYGAIENQCVYRISRTAMNKHQAMVAAKGDQRAKLANN